ncbi:MAG: hypothetical protein WCF28_00750 [Methanobacterium sp.]|uniref:hypothetical protein n=1 Tax=Methanobacterium sp. TaxID=2164 RepID=UPI003C77C318
MKEKVTDIKGKSWKVECYESKYCSECGMHCNNGSLIREHFFCVMINKSVNDHST